MENAITLDNWSSIATPSLNLGLMGIPGPEDPRDWPEGPINTSRIVKVIRTTDGIFVQTRNTLYKLGTVDPDYVVFREITGVGSTDPIDALIDWAKEIVEFEDRAS
ncbi:MAG: hypothetical protein V3T23_06995 [Nitrososphaerales archaeon]